ncbi:MAG: hypothetical protein A2W25_12175 [candidate division Zixibacteria bacterium RBG_16_53_22]|nr:MAG: hypothetical protein A2W25_12175 [candidate division Zixibacteria bacterium RBG_16_53_22]
MRTQITRLENLIGKRITHAVEADAKVCLYVEDDEYIVFIVERGYERGDEFVYVSSDTPSIYTGYRLGLITHDDYELRRVEAEEWARKQQEVRDRAVLAALKAKFEEANP